MTFIFTTHTVSTHTIPAPCTLMGSSAHIPNADPAYRPLPRWHPGHNPASQNIQPLPRKLKFTTFDLFEPDEGFENYAGMFKAPAVEWSELRRFTTQRCTPFIVQACCIVCSVQAYCKAALAREAAIAVCLASG